MAERPRERFVASQGGVDQAQVGTDKSNARPAHLAHSVARALRSESAPRNFGVPSS